MKATPQFRADPEEYPELGTLVNAVIRNVVELMEAHDIGSVRRFRKDGVFDRPYVKDVVTPLGVPGVPVAVVAVRDTVGRAVLDYLETVGITGLSLEATPEEKASVGAIWAPPRQQVPPAVKSPVMDPTPVKQAEKAQTKKATQKKAAAKPETKKEPKNGQS